MSGIFEMSGQYSCCARCREEKTTMQIRNESLCQDCFVKYVVSKCTKRLSDFKVKGVHGERCRKILLPLSFGASSLSLLHILHQHVQRQKERTNRQGYEVCVLHVDESAAGTDTERSVSFEGLEQDYPLHSYHVCRLDDMSLREEDDKDTQGLLRRLSVATGQSDPGSNLHRYLSRLPSTSSFEDISAILRTQLVIHRARVLGCEAILWGDSTTRLAERTLAETAKGRGFSLPWLVNDSSPHGIELIYPLRDLLRKELALFTSVTEPSLERYITRGSPTLNQVKSSKKSTIDGLMTQYFESVEQNYPSIVNNVVRTGSKLRPSEDFQDQSRCQVCNLPLNDEDDLNREELKNREEGSWAESDRQVQSLCYGCHRSTQGSTSEIMKGAG